MTKLIVVTLFFSLASITSAGSADLPAVTHYSLKVKFALKERQIYVAATVTVKNQTERSQSTLPFLLYRLLSVEKAMDDRV